MTAMDVPPLSGLEEARVPAVRGGLRQGEGYPPSLWIDAAYVKVSRGGWIVSARLFLLMTSPQATVCELRVAFGRLLLPPTFINVGDAAL